MTCEPARLWPKEFAGEPSRQNPPLRFYVVFARGILLYKAERHPNTNSVGKRNARWPNFLLNRGYRASTRIPHRLEKHHQNSLPWIFQVWQSGFILHCLRHGMQRNGGRPFFPFIFRFFIQVENRIIGCRVLKIGRGGKLDAAADESLGGFGADIRAAKQADVDVDAAGIPKF